MKVEVEVEKGLPQGNYSETRTITYKCGCIERQRSWGHTGAHHFNKSIESCGVQHCAFCGCEMMGGEGDCDCNCSCNSGRDVKIKAGEAPLVEFVEEDSPGGSPCDGCKSCAAVEDGSFDCPTWA